MTRTDEAYVEIKRRILDLEMAPGTSFTEGALAADLGLSKTPIREALGRLRQERLVDAVARSGYQVVPVTLKDARGLLQVRGVLEAEAAALAAQQGVDIDALLQLDELCRQEYDPDDPDSILGFVRANARLHVALARMGGNETLAAMLEDVLERLHRPFFFGLRHSPRDDQAAEEHLRLLDAVKAGDVPTARKLAAAHARGAQRMVIDGLLASPALQSTNLGAGSM